MPRFNSDDIARVKESIDIVEIVSETVELHHKGRALWGCCPFHAEDTPSFKVDPERQQWYCFSCSEGGDVLSFVMKRDGIGFADAMSMLAERAHVDIDHGRDEGARRPRRDPLASAREAASAAAKLLTGKLAQAPEGGSLDAALAALGHNRESAIARGLGYVPPRSSAMAMLGDLGYSADALAAAGVDKHLDAKSSGRIVLPVRDAAGRPTAFAAADAPAFAADVPALTTGTAACALFDRSSAVYGLDRAKKGVVAHGLAIVVDNPATAELLAAKGVDNVVATVSCPLTPAHAELLGSLAPNLAYLFDGTMAGRRAEGFAARLVDWNAVGKAADGQMCACTAHIGDGKTVAEAVRGEGAEATAVVMTAIATGSTIVTTGNREGGEKTAQSAEKHASERLGSLDAAVTNGRSQLKAQREDVGKSSNAREKAPQR